MKITILVKIFIYILRVYLIVKLKNNLDILIEFHLLIWFSNRELYFILMNGGIALIIGLGTRIVSALFSLLMIGAILKVKLSVGLLGNGQMAGYELDLGFLAMAVFLVISGSKLLSIDQLFSKKDSNEIRKAA
ncbi:DoxX family protein [Neobacillus bataviensis]|uniref:DoxX family protein n=1 Tax=Neobacillus bataviensis TaxID=220685 RepID=UPI001CBF4759|nr:DoxX family protein [Neobacillus bataviensis]